MLDESRWKRLNEIWQAAMAVDPEHRAKFVAESCGDDAELRAELESLLASDAGAGDFLEPPEPTQATNLTGQKFAHYEILEKVGEGGMGVVWKARDTHLDRFVAIKVLPEAMTRDPSRKARFVKEAKAASALNHPNIVHIYDIASEGETAYIAMEYIEGKTLDRMIPGKGMKLKEALKIAAQMAGGLAAAHASGIVHRDVKPANVIVSGSGLVKLLDFGVAKLTEPEPVDEASTGLSALRTQEGMVVGTASYMSPEQAEGRAIDARSDVFSLGALLYEMVTGQRAFKGNDRLSTLTAVVQQDPAPMPEKIHPDLQKIISRCLRKDPERRFQFMKDLQVELEELQVDTVESTSKAAPDTRAPRRRRLLFIAVLVSVVALTSAAVWRWQQGRYARTPSAIVQLTTSPGTKSTPAFSPDGKQFAYTWATGGNVDIYVSQVGVEGAQRLTDHPDVDTGPQWSPDGKYIAFTRFKGRAVGEWTQIQHVVKPNRGGVERIVFNWERKAGKFKPLAAFVRAPAVAWMPDSRGLLAVVPPSGGANEASLRLFSLDGEEQKTVLTPPAGYRQLGYPALSPDARTVAFAAFDSAESADLFLADFGEATASASRVRKIATERSFILGIAFVGGGGEVVYANRAGLWRTLTDGIGRPKKLPFSVAGDISPAYLGTIGRLAFARAVFDGDNYKLEVGGHKQPSTSPAPLPWNSTKPDYCADISPDGTQLAFLSSRSGKVEIWVGGPGQHDVRQLTFFERGEVVEPRWSPDGKWITFYGSADGNREIYVINSSGGRPKRLTKNNTEDGSPGWSPDGKWIYYASAASGVPLLTRIPAEGGAPTTLEPSRSGWRSVVSPDGQHVYYCQTSMRPGLLFRAPLTGGEEEVVASDLRSVAFALTQSRLYYIATLEKERKGFPIFEIDLGTQKRREVALLKSSDGTPGLFLSAREVEGKTALVFSLSRTLSVDLMMLENFR